MRRSRYFGIALAITMLLPITGAVTSPEPRQTDTPPNLVVPLFFESTIPEDVELVNEALNELTLEKIGATVELVPLLNVIFAADTRRIAEVDLMKKQGIEFDIHPDRISSNFIALDDLLPEYGQGILETIAPEHLLPEGEDEKIYRLPSASDYVATSGIAMRRDILEELGVKPESIVTLDDVDKLFDRVRQRYPQIKMTCSYASKTSFLYRQKQFFALSDNLVDFAQDDADQLVNYYATAEYRETLSLFRKWNDQGYLPEDMGLQNVRASEMVKAGELFSYFTSYTPGNHYDESVACGRDMVTIPLAEPVITRRSLNLTCWGVSDSCTTPELAVAFLDLLYTDEEVVNLLVYGLEGVHYELMPDGTVTHAQGVEESNPTYYNQLPWMLPNQTLCRVWTGYDPEMWDKTRAYFETATESKTLHFTFDAEPVRQQYNRVNDVLQTYLYGLETGQLDPEIYLPMMLEEMDAAGVDRIVREAQDQYDQFLAEGG